MEEIEIITEPCSNEIIIIPTNEIAYPKIIESNPRQINLSIVSNVPETIDLFYDARYKPLSSLAPPPVPNL